MRSLSANVEPFRNTVDIRIVLSVKGIETLTNVRLEPTSTKTLDEKSILKIAGLSLIGASAEWFDFFLFGTAAALVFPKVFFPADDPALAVLLSFATLGVGFVARPLGGALWGHFGDKFGRKRAFLAALMTMAVASVMVGLLPTYAAIGIAAPILLCVLRLAQGIAVGGQWGGAVLLATEHAPEKKRGYYGSFAQMGVPIGLILGVCAYFGLSTLMEDAAFLSYGWRIPFILSVLLVAVTIYAKAKLEDTPEFKELQKQVPSESGEIKSSRSPVLQVVRRYWLRILLAGGAVTVANASFYVYVTFLLDYGTRTLHMSTSTVLTAIAIGGLVTLPCLPIFAAVSDRFGRRGIYMAGAICTALWAFPLFALADTGTLWGYTIALTGGLVAFAMMYGPLAAFFAELFTAELRYSGASLSYQLGALLGGAVSPIIAVSLLEETGSTASISIYIIVMSVVAVGCVVALKGAVDNPADQTDRLSHEITSKERGKL